MSSVIQRNTDTFQGKKKFFVIPLNFGSSLYFKILHRYWISGTHFQCTLSLLSLRKKSCVGAVIYWAYLYFIILVQLWESKRRQSGCILPLDTFLWYISSSLWWPTSRFLFSWWLLWAGLYCSFETEILSLCIYKKCKDSHKNYKSKWYPYQLSLRYLKKPKQTKKIQQNLLNLLCLFNWQIHSKNLVLYNASNIPLKVVFMPYDIRHNLGILRILVQTFLSLLALITDSYLRLCLNKNGIYCIHD